MTKVLIRARESVVRRTCGQTMTEYTLVVVAIAIAVFSAYLSLGNNLDSLAKGVDSSMTNA